MVTDHGRGPLSETTTRIGFDKRMANGTMRRHNVALKRTWSCSWENVPSKASATGMKTADGNMYGEDMENFHHSTPGKFRMVLRKGTAIDKAVPTVSELQLPYEDDNFYIANVMFTSFSKETLKRGTADLLNISITLEEV